MYRLEKGSQRWVTLCFVKFPSEGMARSWIEKWKGGGGRAGEVKGGRKVAGIADRGPN